MYSINHLFSLYNNQKGCKWISFLIHLSNSSINTSSYTKITNTVVDSLLFFRHPHDVVVSNGGLSCSRRTNKQQWFPMSEESFQEKHLPSSFIGRNHQLADLSIRQSVKILVLNFLKSWCFSILAIPKSNSHGTNFHLSENSSWKCFNTVKPAPSLNLQKLAREYL